MSPAVPTQRDVRLDLFRGIALWLIFLDHIPNNIVNWFTIRNYGFSDAAEAFVFISGYTAAFVYGRAMRERGFLSASLRILRRVWQLYTAQIFLFVIFIAQIAYVARTFGNPLFAEEMGILEFLREPHVTLVQALLLTFKPANMDILPVYIVLLLCFPPLLWLLLRRPTGALMASVALYVLVYKFEWYLPAYPTGFWIINPFHWQLLFVVGAWCALYWNAAFGRSPITLSIAGAYLLFALAIVVTWYVPHLEHFLPRRLLDFIYPIEKTNLDVLRLAHFAALAVLVARFVPRDWSALQSPALRPAILCGQHSLEIFCLGIFLSFAGHFVLTEISGTVAMQILVSLSGIAIMTATAAVMAWYQIVEGRGRGGRERLADADIAGGEV
jgi:hypothetical protein